MDDDTLSRGWLSHDNPISLNIQDPRYQENVFTLFLTQALIIIALCNILGYTAQRLGQPKVVGELLAGVLIGPTAFQNIPGFTQTIFPAAAKSYLSLVSSFGLVSFLFLVGVETDTDLIIKYWKSVVLITVPPFAASFAVAVGVSKIIYDKLSSQEAAFTTFFVFVGTVMAVTSLSVLSRVLAEMGLLTSRLGATTIAAGAANDTLGYCLLAIASSLAGGGKQIFALYQLLAFTAYLLVLIFIWRPILFWLLVKKEGIDLSPDSKDHVPRWLILIGVLGGLFSSFVGDIFGLHQLVGAFAYGVVIPHGRFGIAVTEAIETPIVSLLLPLYFGAVGLQIDFKTLDNGVTWGLTVLLIAACFITKAGTTTLFSKVAGLDWRQSMCVGALMQSKGVIEVVIGGIALQDGVIDTRIFSMLFFTFLFTTCTVRPLARAIYLKQSEQQKEQQDSSDKDTQQDDGGPALKSPVSDADASNIQGERSIFGITVALSSINPSVGGLMALMGLVGDKTNTSTALRSRVTLDILRLLPVEYGPASILRLIFSPDHQRDTLLEALKTVAVLNAVKSSRLIQSSNPKALAASQWDDSQEDGDSLSATDSQLIPTILQAHRRVLARCRDASRSAGQTAVEGLVVCPWEAPAHIVHSQSLLSSLLSTSGFKAASYSEDDSRLWRASADAQALPARLFRQLQTSTGVLVDSNALRDVFTLPGHHDPPHTDAALERLVGLSCSGDVRKPRVVVPFFGGPDDRAAVALARVIAETSSGQVHVLVVASSSVEGLHDERRDCSPSEPPSAARSLNALQPDSAVGDLSVTEREPRSAEEDNQETINLKTIHQPEARHADARFLFGGMGTEGSDGGEAAEQRATTPAHRSDAEEGASEGDVKVRVVGGVRLVSIPLNPDRAVEDILATSSSLLDRRRPSDLVIVGRGKQGSRTGAFRAEVDSLRQRAQTGARQGDALRHVQRDEADEIKAMGRTLGAAAEGALLFGLTEDGECGATMLVVQAATEPSGRPR